MQHIIERLEIQVASLQESFQLLSKSRSLPEMAKNFFQILRGNLLVVDANIFYCPANSEEWQELFVKNAQAKTCCDLFEQKHAFQIKYLDHPDFKAAIIQPLIDKSTIGILLGNKLDSSAYHELDKIMLPFLLQQLDSAYQFYVSQIKEKKLLFSLNHRVLQLNSLIETGYEIARLQQGTTLLNLALERVLALTNASAAMLRIKEGRQVVQKIFFPLTFKSKPLENGPFCISTEFKFRNRKFTFYLFEKESRTGKVTFDATDQLLLDAFARQVHISLENHYLHEQALEMNRVEQEISVAGTIQNKLIPETLPNIDGYDLAGINIPTKYVGGDYYDCIPLKDGRYALVIADVSGKGIPAALLVSTFQASLHAYLDSPFELADLVQKLNVVIYNSSTMEKYITAFFAILDPKSGTIDTVSAGHNPIYLIRRSEQVEELKTGGIPLGMLGLPFPYTSQQYQINRGDHLLLYTDGVTEAMNSEEEEYDDVIGLKNFILGQRPDTADSFIDNLNRDLQDFTGDNPQSDDITAFYVMRDE